MNLKEIKKKYPKAYKKWLEWDKVLIENKALESIYNRSYNERNLYDFFDKQEIMCYLYFDVELQMWLYNMVEKQEDGYWSGGGAGGGKPEERKKAEKYMFLKAFEILENKLS